MAPTTAAKANAEADAAGIDATLVRVLCVRCAKLLADPEMVESGVCCEWTSLLTYAHILIVSQANGRSTPIRSVITAQLRRARVRR